MALDHIVVKGAREHNLKNIDVSIPRDQLVLITGPSGSGKSTLAFDTIYAEGQRRYVESLSAYARQFLGRMDKPDVDYIEGLSPAISIDQKGVSHNPRSTVGTVTEVYDYLRLLFARIGHPHCHSCGRAVARQTVQQIVQSVLDMPKGVRFMLLAPRVVHKKGEHREIFDDARNAGFVRVRVNGEVRGLDESIDLDKKKWHDIEVVVDRLVLDDEMERSRVVDSVETALRFGEGQVRLVEVDFGKERLFSEHLACLDCGTSLAEIEPRSFSFNSPHGACPSCTGLGIKLVMDPDLVIPDRSRSLEEGAIQPWAHAGPSTPWYTRLLHSVAEQHGIPMNVPVQDMDPKQVDLLLYGSGEEERITLQPGRGRRSRWYHQRHRHNWETSFHGVIPSLERRHNETSSDFLRGDIERYMAANPCSTCHGTRLKPETLAVTVGGKNIIQVTNHAVGESLALVRHLAKAAGPLANKRRSTDGWHIDKEPATLSDREKTIANQILKEIDARLSFLVDIGLDYLTLSRTAGTLSGGEAQRIRLATQIGSGLMGVLYVCDEPSVGLHAVDNRRLISTLQRLRDLGNTVIIVEHDEALMRAADHIVDLGPGAGEHGGVVVAQGTIDDIIIAENSLTGAYLAGRRQITMPTARRSGNGLQLRIKEASENNLSNVTVDIPLGKLVCVTGVSGSGKSTLINEVLYKWLAQRLYHAKDRPGASKGVEGLEHIDKVVNIDQSPIGRTPRSNPTTYTGAFTPIRELFASLPEAKARGYAPGRFSFNVKGGRCEACSGDGYIEIQMQFLPDVTVPCEVCGGKRYNEDALEILLKEKSIADVLHMTVTEAHAFFENFPRIKSKFSTLEDVGLGYIRLGQPATTLSGGEAQRVKLATELSKKATGRTLYILDEPTTGLAFDDCAHLLHVLHRLVDTGNTVLLIEHHLDLIKNADWVIDLGPGAGLEGGAVVATGTPEQLVEHEDSYTGQYLRGILAKHGWHPPDPNSNGHNGRAKTKGTRRQKAKAGS
jgi:excinuclease ABC subunit A